MHSRYHTPGQNAPVRVVACGSAKTGMLASTKLFQHEEVPYVTLSLALASYSKYNLQSDVLFSYVFCRCSSLISRSAQSLLPVHLVDCSRAINMY
jgi:hypothetical protein